MEKDGETLQAQIELLQSVERQMRREGDVKRMLKTALDILELCFEAGACNMLNEQIVLISKRRGQLQEVVQAMVQQTMKYIDQIPELDTKIELIKTLNSVSAGKMYVEIERVRLIKKLAKIKEEQGRRAEASDLMQEIEVERFDSTAKNEKIDFVLEQIRLCLDCEDYARAHVLFLKTSFLSWKFIYFKEGENIVEEVLADVPSWSELKCKYYQLMIRHCSHGNYYLQIYQCYKHIYETPSVKEDSAHRISLLKKICWYLVLAPRDPLQSSLLHSTLEEKNLSEIPHFRSLLKQLVTMEVIHWTVLWNTFKDEFENEKSMFGGSSGEKAFEDLKLRVIEHNIIAVSESHSQINLKRLADLLCLTVQEAESHLSNMVVSKSLVAKIDRPKGVVCFQSAMDINEILNSWAMNLEKLLHLVDKSCHQIHKETGREYCNFQC